MKPEEFSSHLPQRKNLCICILIWRPWVSVVLCTENILKMCVPVCSVWRLWHTKRERINVWEKDGHQLKWLLLLVVHVFVTHIQWEREMLQLCKVTECLLISNARSACSTELIQQEAVTLCINVSRQQPFPSGHVCTVRIPVFDDPNEDLYKYFDQCADAIATEAVRGGHSVVYCKNGRSRSATICVAYLMKHQGLSLAEAFQVGRMLLWRSNSLRYVQHFPK